MTEMISSNLSIFLKLTRYVSGARACRPAALSDVGTRLPRARHQTARQRHLAIIFRGLHGYSFLTTTLDLQFHQSRGNKSLSRIFFETKLLGKDGYHERSLFTTRRSQSKPAGPHKHKRGCCRVALSSAPMPKPRGKAFKRARL